MSSSFITIVKENPVSLGSLGNGSHAQWSATVPGELREAEDQDSSYQPLPTLPLKGQEARWWDSEPAGILITQHRVVKPLSGDAADLRDLCQRPWPVSPHTNV